MGNNNRSRLSVLLITYNHAAHVAKAMESILMQDIAEPFELIVADDGSTDGTVEIVKALLTKNPSLTVTYLDASVNRGITQNYKRSFNACGTEYVAVLEGDDYWCSPSKLREQVAFLDEHRECDLCSVNYYVYEQERAQFTPRTRISEEYIVFGARELIHDNLVGNFSTCMYRTKALKAIPPEIYEIRSYDWAINICLASNGLIGFLTRPMSVYRIHTGGAWSNLEHVEKLQAQLDMIPEYDRVTKNQFHVEFMVLAERIRNVIADARGAGNQAAPIEHQAHPMTSEIATPRRSMRDYVPPFFVSIGKQVIPPRFQHFFWRK